MIRRSERVNSYALSSSTDQTDQNAFRFGIKTELTHHHSNDILTASQEVYAIPYDPSSCRTEHGHYIHLSAFAVDSPVR